MVTAQHLAVFLVTGAALAPCRDMIGIHLGEFIDAGAVAAFLQGTVGAVAHALCLGGLGLLGIDVVDRRLVKHADVQQDLVLFSFIISKFIQYCNLSLSFEVKMTFGGWL